MLIGKFSKRTPISEFELDGCKLISGRFRCECIFNSKNWHLSRLSRIHDDDDFEGGADWSQRREGRDAQHDLLKQARAIECVESDAALNSPCPAFLCKLTRQCNARRLSKTSE